MTIRPSKMRVELLSFDGTFSVELSETIIEKSITISNILTDCSSESIVELPSKFNTKFLLKFKDSLIKLTCNNALAALVVYDFLECLDILYEVGKWVVSNLDEIPDSIYHIIITHPKILCTALLRNLISLNNISKCYLKHNPTDDEIATLINNYGFDNLYLIGDKLSISFDRILNKSPFSIFNIKNNNLFTALLCSNPSIIKEAFESFRSIIELDSQQAVESICDVNLIGSRLIAYKKLSPNSYDDDDLLNLSFKVRSEYILEKMDLSTISCSKLDFDYYVDIKQHLDFIFLKASPKFISSLMCTMCIHNRRDNILYLSNKYENCELVNTIMLSMNLGDVIFLIIMVMLLPGCITGTLSLMVLLRLICLNGPKYYKASILFWSVLNCIDIIILR